MLTRGLRRTHHLAELLRRENRRRVMNRRVIATPRFLALRKLVEHFLEKIGRYIAPVMGFRMLDITLQKTLRIAFHSAHNTLLHRRSIRLRKFPHRYRRKIYRISHRNPSFKTIARRILQYIAFIILVFCSNALPAAKSFPDVIAF